MRRLLSSLIVVIILYCLSINVSYSAVIRYDSPTTLCGTYHYENDTVIINTTITVCDYNGTSGTGELIIYADIINITQNGKIDAKGKGYRGGTVNTGASTQNGNIADDYCSFSDVTCSSKDIPIYDLYNDCCDEGTDCLGVDIAVAGGGIGGGGAVDELLFNERYGGEAGEDHCNCGFSSYIEPYMAYDYTSKMGFGGYSGAHATNVPDYCHAGKGGDGGGYVFMHANILIVNGIIDVSGTNGDDAYVDISGIPSSQYGSSYCAAGGGGGGGGGMIVLEGRIYGSGSLYARGGNGGYAAGITDNCNEDIMGGGSGGDGGSIIIRERSTSDTEKLAYDVSGGYGGQSDVTEDGVDGYHPCNCEPLFRSEASGYPPTYAEDGHSGNFVKQSLGQPFFQMVTAIDFLYLVNGVYHNTSSQSLEFYIDWNDTSGYSIEQVKIYINLSGNIIEDNMTLYDPYINASENKGRYKYELPVKFNITEPGIYYWKSQATSSDGVSNETDWLPFRVYEEDMPIKIYPIVEIKNILHNLSGNITLINVSSEDPITTCCIGNECKDYTEGITFSVDDITNTKICCNSSVGYYMCYSININLSRQINSIFLNNSLQRIFFTYETISFNDDIYKEYEPSYKIVFPSDYNGGNRILEKEVYKSNDCISTVGATINIGNGTFIHSFDNRSANYYFDPFYDACFLLSSDWIYYELFDNVIWASYEGDWLKEECEAYQNTSFTSNLTQQYVDVLLTVNNTANVAFSNVTEFISYPNITESQNWSYSEFKYRIKVKLTNPTSTAFTNIIVPVVFEDRWFLRARVTDESGNELPYYLERSKVLGDDSIIYIKTDLPANSEKYLYIYFTENTTEASSISINSSGNIFKDYDGFEGSIDSNWYFDDASIWNYSFSSNAAEGEYILSVNHPGTGFVYMYRNISIEDGDFISMYLLHDMVNIYLNYTTGEAKIPYVYKLFRYPISRSGYLSEFPILTYGRPSVNTVDDLVKIKIAIPGRLDYAQSAELEEVTVNGLSISTCNGVNLPLTIPLNKIHSIECSLPFNATSETPIRAIYKFNISFSRLIGYPYDYRFVIADILPSGNYTLKIGIYSDVAETIPVLDSYKISNFAYMDSLPTVLYDAHSVALHDRMPLYLSNITVEGSYVNFTWYLDQEFEGWLGREGPNWLQRAIINGEEITTCEGQSLPLEVTDLFSPHTTSCSLPSGVTAEECFNFSVFAIILNITNIRHTHRLLDSGDLKYRLSYISFDYHPLNKNITQCPLLYEVYNYVQDKYNDTIEISSLDTGVSTYKKLYTGDWLQETWKSKEQDTSQTSNLSRQYIKIPLQVNNTLSIDFSNIEWSYSPEPSETCLVCSGSLNIPAQGTASTYAQVYGDWIDESYKWQQDMDKITSAGGIAYIEKVYNLTNTHPTVNFADVEIPYLSREGWNCSVFAGKFDISAGETKEITNILCNKTNVITKVQNLTLDVESVTVDSKIQGHINLTGENTDPEITFNNVLVQADIPDYYTNTSPYTFTINLPPGGTYHLKVNITGYPVIEKNYTVYKVLEAGGEKYIYKGYVEVRGEEVSDKEIVYKIPKARLPMWSYKQAYAFYVDNIKAGFSTTETDDYVIIKVPNTFSSSSLHTGTHLFEVYYWTGLEVGGGGGGYVPAMPTYSFEVKPEEIKYNITKPGCYIFTLNFTWTGPNNSELVIWYDEELAKYIKRPKRGTYKVSDFPNGIIEIEMCIYNNTSQVFQTIELIYKRIIGNIELTVKTPTAEYGVKVPVTITWFKEEAIEKIPITHICGNGICEPGENWMNCPQDCKPPVGLFVLVGIIILVVVYLLFLS